MSCNDCRSFDNNSCTDIISSSCVKTMFTPVEELEICLGDSLTYVGNIILTKIKDLIKGRGIILEDLTLSDCEYISDLLSTDEKNLLNVLRVYKEAICQLNTNYVDINTLLTEITNVSGYTLGCLDPDDPCGNPLTFKALIQAIITKLCALDEQFITIANTILLIIEESVGNFLIGGAIKSCGNNGISFSGTGSSAVVTFEALVPPNCPILFTGSTSFFDSLGVGIPNTPYCGWYLCNGDNNTPNSSNLPQNDAEDLVYIIRFT